MPDPGANKMVKIPDALTNRLQGLGPHFCLVQGKDPSIGGKGWQLPENLMFSDDPRLQGHLKKGGNYGVVTGYGLTVVEADHQKIKDTVEASLPPTFAVLSPGHQTPHYYFLCSFQESKPLVDPDNQNENIGHIKGQGGMVVGPSSIHPDVLKEYTILYDRDLAQVTPQQLRKALESYMIPEKQIQQIEATARQEKRESKTDLSIADVVPLSGLHRLGKEYFGPHPVHGSETGRNFWVNTPKGCWHCFRHGSGGGPLLWLAVESKIIDCSEAGPGALRGKIFKKILAKARERGLIKKEKNQAATAVGEYFDDNGKFIPAFLAEELMSDTHFATMMDSKEIYVYIDGYYQPLGEVLIKRECKHRLGDEYRKNRAGEVTDYIEASTYVKRREESTSLLPLNNGVLDIYTMELYPYSPEYMFFNKLPVNYNPKADCPEIRKFHKEITNDEQDIKVLEETIGYCLYRGYLVHKALMLVGGGANGKSTWLSLVRTFLGPKNVSGRSLFELEEVRFAKADLFGKYANIYADLPDRALQRTGMFKMLTGGDQLAAEKKFRDSFHFINYAKLLFSANKVPETVDDTDAFFRRWIIIPFPNVFNGESCDPQKLEKITTEAELSGLLNIALAALKRLLNNGGFSYAKTTDELREDYIRKSSPIASFVIDCLGVDSDAFIEKKALFNVFAAYCRTREIPCVTQTTFFKNLPRHVAIVDFRPTVGGRRIHTFKGIRYIEGVSRVFESLSVKEAQKGLMSNMSNMSKVFYTLIEQKKQLKEPWKVMKLDDPCYIKVGITVDRLDTLDRSPKQASFDKTTPKTLDTKQKLKSIEEMLPTTCWICHQALPSDSAYCTVLDGKTVHETCHRQLKAQEKGVGTPRELGKLSNQQAGKRKTNCKSCKHFEWRENQPFCEYLGAFLASETLTQPCDNFEGERR